MLTQRRLIEALHYDSRTGVFSWLVPPHNHPRLRGQAAGCDATGYVMIKVDGRAYKAHRLAWLYVHGEWPAMRIDHRDGNPLNNSIENLRPATQAQNCANAAKWRGKALPKGVRQMGERYQARIRFERRLVHLGTFATPQDAANAYERAARDLYGEFARTA